MGSPLERRGSGGRRLSDSRDARALRGLLHDLGHEITTLSYLVEAVRTDKTLHRGRQSAAAVAGAVERGGQRRPCRR
jgi:hypothetical protein